MATEDEKDQKEWQLYYPFHSFDDKEILLKEYELSSNNILSQEKIFTNASNLTLISSTIIASVLGVALKNTSLRETLLSLEFLIPIILVVVLGSLFTMKYFAERQKSIVFDSRKIIVLRSMLSLSYGSQQLVLPNWRIEGASNPFKIKHFPGWTTIVTYPFWIVALFSTLLLYFIIPSILDNVRLSSFLTDANSNIKCNKPFK